MKITRDDLRWAVDQKHLEPGQDEALWRALSGRQTQAPQTPRFDAANVAYYAGALIVIGAMGWFMTKAWDALDGLGLVAIALAYAMLFLLLGRWVWDRLGLRVPGGLLFTMAVSMTPLATYGLLKRFDLWPHNNPGAYQDFHVWVKGSWITLEIATVLAGLVMLRFRKFAFLTAPIALALWYLSMDLAPLLMGVSDFDWEVRRWISLWFGLAMLVGAYAVDLSAEGDDFAFWLYLFGLLAFWGGLSLMNSDSEFGKFTYALINLGLILVALVLGRVVFLIFGALGVSGYLGHLAFRIFADSLLFPVVLTALGLSVIAVGVIYQRNRLSIVRAIDAALPDGVRRLVPRHRASK